MPQLITSSPRDCIRCDTVSGVYIAFAYFDYDGERERSMTNYTALKFEEDGKWWVVEDKGFVKISGPFKTRKAAVTAMRIIEHE